MLAPKAPLCLHPFLKWAGGKRWLVERHAHLLPANVERLIEPFLGSGAVFFKLVPPKALLSDTNAELISTYKAIVEDWRSVADLLSKHHERHSAAYYYKMRNYRPQSRCAAAARFIYLNRTCWNGLYRVNQIGVFNVPIGTKQSVVLKSDRFEETARALRSAKLLHGDFEETIEEAKSGDFLFVDPPYTVSHNNNGFIKYNENLFSWNDQIRLKEAVVRSVKKGVLTLVTNANHDNLRSLYRGVGEHVVVTRKSVISGKTIGRRKYDELVVKCY